MILVDGPPGAGCPVIAAMTGIDLVIAVVEPSASSHHDFRRVRELAEHFRIRTALIVNKHDLAPDLSQSIQREAAGHGVAILGQIPYDDAVLKAIAAGAPITDFAPDSPASSALYAIAEAVRGHLTDLSSLITTT